MSSTVMRSVSHQGGVVPGSSEARSNQKNDTKPFLCLRLQCITKQKAVNRNMTEAVTGVFSVFLEAR